MAKILTSPDNKSFLVPAYFFLWAVALNPHNSYYSLHSVLTPAGTFTDRIYVI